MLIKGNTALNVSSISQLIIYESLSTNVIIPAPYLTDGYIKTASNELLTYISNSLKLMISSFETLEIALFIDYYSIHEGSRIR